MSRLEIPADFIRKRNDINGMPLRFDYRMFGKNGRHVSSFKAFRDAGKRAEKFQKMLLEGKSPILMDGGVPMIGWKTESPYIGDELGRIYDAAERLSKRIDVLYSIGIGGSDLGPRATTDAVRGSLDQVNHLSRKDRDGSPRVFFLGNNIDPGYLARALEISKGRRVGACIISKSGDTVEPAIAFNVLLSLMERNMKPSEMSERVVAITDATRGTLRELAIQRNLTTFTVPDNIGGRYSVTSPVGLFPLAVAGVDIMQFIAGAKFAEEQIRREPFDRNIAMLGAAMRYVAHVHWGKDIELASTNVYDLRGVTMWWQQLATESQGKNGKGLWVSPEMLTTNAHSTGQMVQMGKRNLTEFNLRVADPATDIMIPAKGSPIEYLDGKSLAGVNADFGESLRESHFRGGVPVMSLILPNLSAFTMGMTYQTLMNIIALDSLMQGQNPFIQPGVQLYKAIAAVRTGKPGADRSSLPEGDDLDPRYVI